jgi:hypothetical protein
VATQKDIIGVFEALQPNTWTQDLKYDVYVGRDRLVAAKTGGQLEAESGGVPLGVMFGLLGGLIQAWLQSRATKKLTVARNTRELMSLDELLADDPKNFEVRLASTSVLHLKKPGFTMHGPAAAKLEIHTADRPRPITLLLRTKAAVEACRSALGAAAATLQQDPALKI